MEVDEGYCSFFEDGETDFAVPLGVDIRFHAHIW